MAFVTEIVLFRARPGIASETAVQTVVEAAEGSRPAIAGLNGSVGADAGRCMQDIDAPCVRLYHFRSCSL